MNILLFKKISSRHLLIGHRNSLIMQVVLMSFRDLNFHKRIEIDFFVLHTMYFVYIYVLYLYVYVILNALIIC